MWPEDNVDNISRENVPADFLGVAGSLRFALIFGAAAIALALFVVPFAQRQAQSIVARAPAGLDTMSTGSIGPTGGGGGSANYTIRRSVLQSTPQSVCIIRHNGARTGDC
jgi:lipopolysaccharide export LptBFGC system permease protein LptF